MNHFTRTAGRFHARLSGRVSARLAVMLALHLVAAGVLATLPVRAEPYRLVAQDRIALRVVEWRSGEAEVRSWEALSGAYTVNDTGAVSIPLVGEVEAAGLTTGDLATRIGDLLKERAGLPNRPFTSVEIGQFGPIYVVGAVDKPGQYPFNPDLTVMKAISLAGGFRLEAEGLGSRTQRELIQAGSTLRESQLEYNSLLMRQARLRAEMEELDTFRIPERLAGIAGIETLHAEELSLMKLRRIELESKLAAAKDLGDLYSEEIQTLLSKIEAQKRQVALLSKELATVSSLVEKGLTVNSRQFALERAESDAENKLLDLELALTRSRQALEENRRDSDDIINTKNSQIQEELNETAYQLAKSELAMRVARLLIDETAHHGQGQSVAGLDVEQSPPKFHIVRRGADGETARIEADADTPVAPRDLIEVEAGTVPGKARSVAAQARPRLEFAADAAGRGDAAAGATGGAFAPERRWSLGASGNAASQGGSD